MYRVFTAPVEAFVVEVVLPFLGAFGLSLWAFGVLLGRRKGRCR